MFTIWMESVALRPRKKRLDFDDNPDHAIGLGLGLGFRLGRGRSEWVDMRQPTLGSTILHTRGYVAYSNNLRYYRAASAEVCHLLSAVLVSNCNQNHVSTNRLEQRLASRLNGCL